MKNDKASIKTVKNFKRSFINFKKKHTLMDAIKETSKTEVPLLSFKHIYLDKTIVISTIH